MGSMLPYIAAPWIRHGIWMYLKHLKTTSRWPPFPRCKMVRPARLQRTPSRLGPHSSRCLVDVQWTTQHLNLRPGAAGTDLFWWKMVEAIDINWSNSKFGGDMGWLLSWSPVFHVLSREIFPWNIPVIFPSLLVNPLDTNHQVTVGHHRCAGPKHCHEAHARLEGNRQNRLMIHINNVVRNGKMGK